MKSKKKTKSHSNKIHNTKRSQDSNFLTTFLDNYQRYFTDCAKFSSRSYNLNYFYNYYLGHYQKFKDIPQNFLHEEDLPQQNKLDVYLDNIGSGDLFQTKKQYLNKITVICKLLGEKYRSLLDQLFQIYDFQEEEIKMINLFLEKIINNQLKEEEMD